MERSPRAGSRVPPWLLGLPFQVLVFFIALTVLVFRRGWADPVHAWIGNPGDPQTYMWYLKWTPWALLHGHNPLFSTHVNFPDGVNMMWNNFEPVVGVLVAPLTFSIGLVFAYNVVHTLGVGLSAWCAYLFLRRHTEQEVSAVVGGLVYGFSPFVMGQALTHSNLVIVVTPPLLAMVFEEIVVHQRLSVRRAGAALGALVSLQLLIGEEYVVYEAVALAAAAAVLAGLHWGQARGRAPYVLRAVGVGVVVTALVAGGPIAYQFAGPRHATTGILHPTEALSADALAFVVPTDLQQVNPQWTKALTGKFTDACCIEEWGSYMGFPLLVLMAVAAVRWWRRDVVKVATVVGALFIVLSMGAHLHVGGTVTPLSMPFRLFEMVPVLGNILPRRLVLISWLCAAVLVAVWTDALLRHRTRRPPVAIAGAVGLVLALVPLLPTFRFPATRNDVPTFFTSGVRTLPRDTVILVAPLARDPNTSAPMLWQAESDYWFRMPEGYVLGADDDGRYTFMPVASTLSRTMQDIQYGGAPPVMNDDLRQQLEHDLAARHIEAVVVGPHLYEQALVAFFTELLGRPPRYTGGVDLWEHVTT